MSLGNRIRRERERMGMNQAELGARVDPQVTREAVTKWENDRSKPRPDTIAQLAALFGMTISELMGEDAGLRSGVRMPLYGCTHAGEPMEEIEGDDYAYVPPIVAERHPRGFLLRVRATHETMMQAAGVPDSVNAAAHGHSVAVAYGHYMRQDSTSATGDVGDMLAGIRGQGAGHAKERSRQSKS